MVGVIERGDYEVIGGKYFKDGYHVPLDERPEQYVDKIEEAFRGREGIFEVTNVASLVSVYASGWDVDEVRRVLAEETAATFQHVGTVDNRLKKNIPEEAEQVFQFRMV